MVQIGDSLRYQKDKSGRGIGSISSSCGSGNQVVYKDGLAIKSSTPSVGNSVVYQREGLVNVAVYPTPPPQVWTYRLYHVWRGASGSWSNELVRDIILNYAAPGINDDITAYGTNLYIVYNHGNILTLATKTGSNFIFESIREDWITTGYYNVSRIATYQGSRIAIAWNRVNGSNYDLMLSEKVSGFWTHHLIASRPYPHYIKGLEYIDSTHVGFIYYYMTGGVVYNYYCTNFSGAFVDENVNIGSYSYFCDLAYHGTTPYCVSSPDDIYGGVGGWGKPRVYWKSGGSWSSEIPWPTINTSLTAGLNAESWTEYIYVSNGSGFPTGGALIKIDSEYIYYLDRTGNTLHDCVRGLHGTSPAAHSNGATVYDSVGFTRGELTLTVVDFSGSPIIVLYGHEAWYPSSVDFWLHIGPSPWQVSYKGYTGSGYYLYMMDMRRSGNLDQIMRIGAIYWNSVTQAWELVPQPWPTPYQSGYRIAVDSSQYPHTLFVRGPY